ncbi:MAG: hypothetical protein Q7S89_01955, partial [bacterium]|nr:hypothetical protein [bacterium]
IAACSHKTPPPQPLPAERPAVEMPAPADTTARETEEAKPSVPPAKPGAEEAKPGAIAPTPPAPPAAVTPTPKTVTITMNDQGFSPANVTLKKGDTIVYKNAGTQPMWPASAIHPTHGAYPEKGGCLGSTFDACRGVKPGESWSFVFNQIGSWGYHDHLAPAFRGKITVE